jgi:hypothetical protein
MGKINVGGRDDAGRIITRQVELTTAVAPGGEPVQVKTEDGRTVPISRKLADLYPERYEQVKKAS